MLECWLRKQMVVFLEWESIQCQLTPFSEGLMDTDCVCAGSITGAAIDSSIKCLYFKLFIK